MAQPLFDACGENSPFCGAFGRIGEFRSLRRATSARALERRKLLKKLGKTIPVVTRKVFREGKRGNESVYVAVVGYSRSVFKVLGAWGLLLKAPIKPHPRVLASHAHFDPIGCVLNDYNLLKNTKKQIM